MERLALIGVSHRRGGAAALETWQTHFDRDALAKLERLGFAESVSLLTCNRWDVAVVLPPAMSIDAARQLLTPPGETHRPYAYVGDAALEQITRITCSLDSLNPGEDQIMSQVKAAYAAAQHAGTVGPRTSFAFQTALRVAKTVRREVALAPMNTSLFSLAKPALERYLPRDATVAILGAGEMGSLAAKTMASEQTTKLIIANRTAERARTLARALGTTLPTKGVSLADFLADPPDIDALICATPVRNIVDDALLDRLPNLKIIVDMGIPRNVDDAALRRHHLPVLDVDTLQHAGQERRQELTARLAEAEMVVQRELGAAIDAWTERQLGPSIKRLRDWYRDTIGDDLDDDTATRLAHKFAHVPIKGLRAVARQHGIEAAKTFLDETGLL